jgi:hypothetical protein
MSKKATTRNDLADMKAILDRARVPYIEMQRDVHGTCTEEAILKLGGPSGTYFKFLIDDDRDFTVRLIEHGTHDAVYDKLYKMEGR